MAALVSVAAALALGGCALSVDQDGGGDVADAGSRRDTGDVDAARIDAGHDASLADTEALADTAALDAAALPDAHRADAGARACPIGGECTLADGSAGACCDDACTDLDSDDTSCGRCGLRCRPGMHCVQGYCAYTSCVGALDIGVPGDTFVAQCVLADGTPRGLCCGDACHPLADFDSDDGNCGGCGFACASGETCMGGDCAHLAPACGASVAATCPAGTSCWAATACLPSGCAGQPDGTICVLPYPRFGACCSGTCADVTRDSANCGACGRVCATGTTCAYYGDCYPLPACSEPGMQGAWCALASGGMGRCCGADCVDPSSDPENCGTCAITCAIGATCMTFSGSGECARALPDGGLGPGGCTTTADCPSGFQCDPDIARCARNDCTGRPDGSACYRHGATGPNSTMCCDGACVDPVASPNCGACGVTCASGVCLNVSSWPARSYVTCLPDVGGSTDCSNVGGCPPDDACIGGVCLPHTCMHINGLCVTAAGAPGTCNWDFVGGATVMTCLAR